MVSGFESCGQNCSPSAIEQQKNYLIAFVFCLAPAGASSRDGLNGLLHRQGNVLSLLFDRCVSHSRTVDVLTGGYTIMYAGRYEASLDYPVGCGIWRDDVGVMHIAGVRGL
jgi:hypothetical protein